MATNRLGGRNDLPPGWTDGEDDSDGVAAPVRGSHAATAPPAAGMRAQLGLPAAQSGVPPGGVRSPGPAGTGTREELRALGASGPHGATVEVSGGGVAAGAAPKPKPASGPDAHDALQAMARADEEDADDAAELGRGLAEDSVGSSPFLDFDEPQHLVDTAQRLVRAVGINPPVPLETVSHLQDGATAIFSAAFERLFNVRLRGLKAPGARAASATDSEAVHDAGVLLTSLHEMLPAYVAVPPELVTADSLAGGSVSAIKFMLSLFLEIHRVLVEARSGSSSVASSSRQSRSQSRPDAGSPHPPVAVSGALHRPRGAAPGEGQARIEAPRATPAMHQHQHQHHQRKHPAKQARQPGRPKQKQSSPGSKSKSSGRTRPKRSGTRPRARTHKAAPRVRPQSAARQRMRKGAGAGVSSRGAGGRARAPAPQAGAPPVPAHLRGSGRARSRGKAGSAIGKRQAAAGKQGPPSPFSRSARAAAGSYRPVRSRSARKSRSRQSSRGAGQRGIVPPRLPARAERARLPSAGPRSGAGDGRGVDTAAHLAMLAA